ncbi:chitin deacetylase [Linnemannia exigua]|uniref:Chitin deacetylase n=1 Tax=Linnemannia exigua TaxID=604196 RepID=A0AAD4D921_9FUNG|nr:chitin deacetylase [Linnemannia exigua]
MMHLPIDGPSPDSPRLYDNLAAHNQKATLFIVGSRAISFPQTLKRAYNEGHQIAIHTWSHPSMTSLTNEQIVAELNGISLKVGSATPQSVVNTFKGWLTKIPSMPHGFIVLEHDLFPEEVNVSINGVLPVAYSTKRLVMQPIAQCLNDGKPYKEGAGAFKLLPGGSGNGAGSGNNNAAPAAVHRFNSRKGLGLLMTSALTYFFASVISL